MSSIGWSVAGGFLWVVGCSTAEKQSNPPSGGTAAAPSAEPSTGAPSAAPADAAPSSDQSPTVSSPGDVTLGNPASDVCTAASGRQESVNSPQGEVGVCVFSDGSRCEVWRLRRKECAPGSCRNTSGICDGDAR